MSEVQLIDLNFQDVPGVIAAHVFDTGDGLAVVDPGPARTLEALECGLRGLGAGLRDVRHVLVTHIHFDHAGAVGTLLEHVPRARAYVHERGAAHLIGPERLLASATQIYGEHMDRLWGEMRPADPERLTVIEGSGCTLKLGRGEVRALHTPGHAIHHVAYHAGDDLFVGDVGGIRLEAGQSPRAPTPPPDIDLEAWRASIHTLCALDARTLHLAHFGPSAHTPAHWDRLQGHLEADAQFVRAGLERGLDAADLRDAFTEHVLTGLSAEGPDLAARFEFASPPWMSVQGLTRYWTRHGAVAGWAR